MLGGPPSRRPRPSGGSPHPPRAALPLTRLQPSAPPLPQRLSLGPGSQPQFARSAAAAQTAAPAAAAAMARALGLYVTSVCPSTTPPHPRQRRRHPLLGARVERDVGARVPRLRDAPVEPASPESRATWGPLGPNPRAGTVALPTLATVPFPRSPPGASAPEGGAWDLLDPGRGQKGWKRGHLPHSASPSGSGEQLPPSPQLLRNPSPAFGEGRRREGGRLQRILGRFSLPVL